MSEHRRRSGKPYLLHIFRLLILVTSPYHYLLAVINLDLSLVNFTQLMTVISPIQLTLVVAPIVIFFVLLFTNAVSWILAILYLISAALLNSYNALIHPTVYNYMAVFEAVFQIYALSFFLQREIYKPFFMGRNQGWRTRERFPINIDVGINHKQFRTIDLSIQGFSVEWKNSNLKENETVNISFQMGDQPFVVSGGVAWVSHKAVGFAFRDLDDKTKAFMRQWISGR